MNLFSLPINVKLNEDYVNNIFIPFLKKYKSYIYDLYFTCRMPPFLQDAMGDVLVGDIRESTYNALYISEQTGIPLSATFNNIHVVPNQQNLDLFLENFKPLYDVGIRIVTLPHTTWMLTGQIKKQFPDLFVKNTILREVTKANEIVSLAKAGFDYINLDRDLMRDKDSLIKIKKAKQYCDSIGKPIKLSLLANEGCWGGCPIMPEHYHYNNTRRPDNPQYFNDSISRVSCAKWDLEDPSVALKAANLPPWKKDWEEFIDLGIDVFKMHGRENAMRLKESMDIIERWADNQEILFPEFNEYIEDISFPEKPINVWRDKIKNCKFDCWDCNYCDIVVQSKLKKERKHLNLNIQKVLNAIDNATKNQSNFVEESFEIQGLSSNIIRHFLNNLCSYPETVYLELGVYTGSTFHAATMNNKNLSFAVDDYSQVNVSPMRDDIDLPKIDNPKQYFLKNLKNNRHCFSDKNILNITEETFFGSKPNVIFYDADHDPKNQFENLNHVSQYFADQFILIIDDANFEGVIESIDYFTEVNNFNILFERKILTTVPEDKDSWWNGIYVLVLQK